MTPLSKMRASLAVVSVSVAALVLTGCASLRVRVPEPRDATSGKGGARSSAATLLAGAARVDITPLPGYPMAGYSWIGRISRGYWLRLYARAVFFEDANGQRLVLVSSDLWALPRGLRARVVELLAGDRELAALVGARRLDNDEIVLAATHTHHGPGGYSTDRMFSVVAAQRIGFDRVLFEFLARRIAAAIAQAAASARPARLSYSVTRVTQVLRNRSFEAFATNPEAREIIASNRDLQACDEQGYAADACRAVDPSLRMLHVDAADGTASIAMALFLAAHPTVIDHRSPIYGSDVFGAVALALERRLERAATRPGAATGRPAPVVAVFNAAEGDVSFRWRRQNRAELIRLRDLVLDDVQPPAGIGRTSVSRVRGTDEPSRRTASVPTRALETTTINSTFDVFKLAHRRVKNADGATARTGRLAIPGRGTLCGAEDGRAGVPSLISREGKRGIDCGAHGRKIGAFDLAEVGGFVIPPLWFTRAAALMVPPEREAAVSVHRVGPLLFATLPGEFTTTLGHKIRTALARAAGVPADDVVLIGLAQSYAYYFAAPAEYDEQHYEGSGTLYGRHAGRLIEERLARLAGQAAVDAPYARSRSHVERYSPGLARRFGPTWIEKRADESEDELEYVLGRRRWKDGAVARWCWLEELRTLDELDTTLERVTPRVQMQVRAGASWMPLLRAGVPEDDEGIGLVTVAGTPRGNQVCWCAYWVAPFQLGESGEVRFAVTRTGQTRSCMNDADCSPPFTPSATPAATCPRPSG